MNRLLVLEDGRLGVAFRGRKVGLTCYIFGSDWLVLGCGTGGSGGAGLGVRGGFGL